MNRTKISVIQRILTVILFALIITAEISVVVSADSFIEYYFIPDDSSEHSTTRTILPSKLLENLPKEIRDNLPEEMFSDDIAEIADNAQNITSFSYVGKRILSGITNTFFPSVKTAFLTLVIIILASIFHTISHSLKDNNTSELVSSVTNGAIALSLIGSGIISFSGIESFKKIICELMNGMVPILGAVYAASGNPGTAAIQSGGILLLVTLCQNLFAKVLLPAIRICLALGIVGAIVPEIEIKPIITAFRNITTTVMLTSVTLFSFMLGLQNTIAQSADTFSARSIKFAVGNLIPIVGGAVSDSLSTVGGSLSVIKSAGGSAAIVMIIILLIPTLSTLVINRFAIFLCKSISGILGCKNEEAFLGEMGSVSSLMLAFAASISVAFIYALTLFTNSSLAISS